MWWLLLMIPKPRPKRLSQYATHGCIQALRRQAAADISGPGTARNVIVKTMFEYIV
jgi:hypothetical protein